MFWSGVRVEVKPEVLVYVADNMGLNYYYSQTIHEGGSNHEQLY